MQWVQEQPQTTQRLNHDRRLHATTNLETQLIGRGLAPDDNSDWISMLPTAIVQQYEEWERQLFDHTATLLAFNEGSRGASRRVPNRSNSLLRRRREVELNRINQTTAALSEPTTVEISETFEER